MRNSALLTIAMTALLATEPDAGAAPAKPTAPSPAKRTDRTAIRKAVAHLRIHPDSADLLQKQWTTRVRLSSGEEVLVAYETFNPGRSGEFQVYGKIAAGEPAIIHLNAKERREVTRIIETARSAHSDRFNIKIAYPSPARIQMARAAGTAHLDIADANYKALRSVIQTLK